MLGRETNRFFLIIITLYFIHFWIFREENVFSLDIDMIDGPRVAGTIVTAILLILSLTHLGLGIGVLVETVRYGSIFRPESGLAGYNIFIGAFGVIVSSFGLFSVLTERGILGNHQIIFNYR
jgi:hypothetical protein